MGSSMKYALMMKLGEGDWIYVTEDKGGNCWDLHPVIYESKERAERAAAIWRNHGASNCKVVEYLREV